MRFFYLIVSVCFLAQPSLATNRAEPWERRSDLWRGIHLFENREFEAAAEIFKNYRKGCPMAYRYYEDLYLKDFLTEKPIEHKEIVNYEQFKHIYTLPIFNNSRAVIEAKKHMGKISLMLAITHKNLQCYSKGKLLEELSSKLARSMKIPTKTTLDNYFHSNDPRSILAAVRLAPKLNRKLLGVPYQHIAKKLKEHLTTEKKTNEVFFKLFSFYNKEHQELSRYFLNYAAGFGHVEAQLLCAQFSKTDECAAFGFGQAALNDDCTGISELAMRFEKGLGVQQDPKKAFAYYRQAAAHPQAIGANFYTLGVCYKNGIGTKINLERALENFIQGANQGDALAAKYAARLLHYRQQFSRAYPYFVQAGQLADDDRLWLHFPSGTTVSEKSLKAGINFWYDKACQNERIAQELLAELILWDLARLEQNIFGVFDVLECVAWLEKWVDATEFPVKSKRRLNAILGAYYYNKGYNKGSAEDHRAAVPYLEIARELGDPDSCLRLASMYNGALGIDRNVTKAMGYYSKATERPEKWGPYGTLLMNAQVLDSLRPIYDKKAQVQFEEVIKLEAKDGFYCDACYNLAILYLYNRVGKDMTIVERREKTENLLLEAAKLDDVAAQLWLGIYYCDQISTGESPLLLAASYLVAPDSSEESEASEETQLNQGHLRPKKGNHEEAAVWWGKAAKQGSICATVNLCILRLSEENSLEKAIKLLEKLYNRKYIYANLSSEEQKAVLNATVLGNSLYILVQDGVLNVTRNIDFLRRDHESIEEIKNKLHSSKEYQAMLQEYKEEPSDSDDESTVSSPYLRVTP
ncbi:MAG: tetratricopeptide repeat protein [Pseudomonadota bacterium]